MLNDLMTIIPERFSRVTRLSLSIRLWMILNFGRDIEKTISIRPIRIITATAIIHDIDVLLPSARIVPPIAIIGA
jgi:hypothetical protein